MFFPKADKLGYSMINRASVQMWGIVRPTFPVMCRGCGDPAHSPLPIWKSIIGRFSNRKWAKRLPDRRFQVHSLFEDQRIWPVSQHVTEKDREPAGHASPAARRGCVTDYGQGGIVAFSIFFLKEEGESQYLSCKIFPVKIFWFLSFWDRRIK